MPKYEVRTKVDLAYVGGAGYAPPHIVRTFLDKKGRRCHEFLFDYKMAWVARLVALLLNFLARWELSEPLDIQLRQPPITQADMDWAQKQFPEFIEKGEREL